MHAVTSMHLHLKLVDYFSRCDHDCPLTLLRACAVLLSTAVPPEFAHALDASKHRTALDNQDYLILIVQARTRCVCVCDLAPSFGRGSVGSVGLPGGWPSCSASTSTSSRRADRASKAQDARGTLICIFSAACRWVGYDPSEANSHRCPLFSVGSWIIRSLKENIFTPSRMSGPVLWVFARSELGWDSCLLLLLYFVFPQAACWSWSSSTWACCWQRSGKACRRRTYISRKQGVDVLKRSR